jgi:hypothetical protein
MEKETNGQMEKWTNRERDKWTGSLTSKLLTDRKI